MAFIRAHAPVVPATASSGGLENGTGARRGTALRPGKASWRPRPNRACRSDQPVPSSSRPPPSPPRDDVACCRRGVSGGRRGVWQGERQRVSRVRRLGVCFGKRLGGHDRRHDRHGPRQRSGHFLEFRCPRQKLLRSSLNTLSPATKLTETRLLAHVYANAANPSSEQDAGPQICKMSTPCTIVTPMLSYKQTYAPQPSPVPRLEDLEDQVHVHPPHLLEGLGTGHRVEVREHKRQALLP